MKQLRKEIRNLYRGADKAYNALDFSGIGYITERDFLTSLICKRMINNTSAEGGGYSEEDLKDFFYQTGAFLSSDGGMNFDSFKKTFFPHLYQIIDSNTTLDEPEIDEKEKLKKLMTNQAQEQKEI